LQQGEHCWSDLIDGLDFAENCTRLGTLILLISMVPLRLVPGCGARRPGRFGHRNLRVSALASTASSAARFVRHRFSERVGQAVALKHEATIGTMRSLCMSSA
jgi:hypothetical protein